jgi:hypothetical protein
MSDQGQGRRGHPGIVDRPEWCTAGAAVPSGTTEKEVEAYVRRLYDEFDGDDAFTFDDLNMNISDERVVDPDSDASPIQVGP